MQATLAFRDDSSKGKVKNACLKDVFQTGITVFTAWLLYCER